MNVTLLIEINGQKGQSVENVERLLSDHDYKTLNLTNIEKEWQLAMFGKAREWPKA